MQIVLATGDSQLRLRAGNFVSVEFIEQDKGTLERYEPCKRLKGVKAKVSFWPPADPANAGEIVAVEIKK